MQMDRRGFLQAILAAGVAPAIVKAANIMPVFSRMQSGLIVPELEVVFSGVVASGNTLLPISMITKEALRILQDNIVFSGHTIGFYERIGAGYK